MCCLFSMFISLSAPFYMAIYVIQWHYFTFVVYKIVFWWSVNISNVRILTSTAMAECPVWKKSFQSHSKVIDCCICESKFHIKCISLNIEDQAEMSNNPSCWYCRSCLCEIFPYNHIEDDKSFVAAINNFRFSDRLAELSDMLFQPFELNTENYYSLLFDIDPDINFYNKIDLHINSNCNYYMEEEFSMVLRNRYNICPTENRLSLCHINIRSLQANLHSFEKYLENIDIKFSCVGVTETWLQDHNCDLYNWMGMNW